MRTDRVFAPVQSLVKALLLGQKHYCSVVILLTWGTVTALNHCALDVSPHVWSIVAIKVDDGFWQRFTTRVRSVLQAWCSSRGAMARNLIKVLSVSHWSNNIDNLMKRHIGVVSQVAVCHVTQNTII